MNPSAAVFYDARQGSTDLACFPSALASPLRGFGPGALSSREPPRERDMPKPRKRAPRLSSAGAQKGPRTWEDVKEDRGSVHMSRLRALFLEHIQSIAPQVLADLHEKALHLHSEKVADAKESGWEWRALQQFLKAARAPASGALDVRADLSFQEVEEAGRLLGEIEAFANAIDEWAQRHTLATDWIRDVALATVRQWAFERSEPKAERPLEWVNPSSQKWIPAIKLRDWDPGRESEEEWDRACAAYKKAIKRLYDEDPFPSRYQDPKHLRWLVRWQVLGHSPGEIARDELSSEIARGKLGEDGGASPEGRGEDIRKAVKDLASLLDLPTRPPGRAGRHRKIPG